ncbi:P-loop containing nucleoside triphosphate hydrolase protein [Penicillium taxi]|uniref:P-loop containing nucleoside triphosphate hydrolase protein n=1 Tax=Penicillium taxi TaxID=168475 RepID=UPI00254533ED|nr:P-loop containing nucleoside triphosphate hydrolase protein [Penicillium taxi]KAJ5902117.1 P-loop containing nucleoside triphosphate hydrolase protein [Penicillium taxi]
MSTVTFQGGPNSGLQVGINHGSIYHSPERPDTPPAPLSTIPFRRDLDFVNRGTLLDQLEGRGLLPGSRIALVGLGGVGKSQLAIEHCHRVRDRSTETWIFWIYASNKSRFEQSCREIADRAKIPGRQDPKANIFKLLHDWLQDEKHIWILVFDNLDDDQFLHEIPLITSDDQSKLDRSIWAYFSQLSRGSIVITSRSRRVALQIVEEEEIILVEPMDESQALALFEKKFGTLTQKDDIIQLIAALEFMPLAIVQAAAYIRRRAPRQSVRQYLDKFQESDHQKTSLLDHEGGHLRRDPEAKNSILITWQISFDYIQRIRPTSADLLSLMSFFDRQRIPDYLLRDDEQEDRKSEHSEVDALEDDILVLRDFSMISVNVDGKNLEMHRLVQLAMQEWLKSHKLYERWHGDFIQRLSSNFPTGGIENWPTCELLFTHVLHAMKQKPKTEIQLEEWASLLHEAGWFALKKGNFPDSEKMAQKSTEVRKELFGQEHPDTLNSTANLASTYRNQGRWNEAEKLEVQVMNTRKQVLGPEHPDTLSSMANLALTYWNQGRWNEAEKLNVQVMNTQKQVLGPEHPNTLTSMANLALTYGDQGRWNEAEKLEVQVMNTSKQVLGPEHPDTLTSMANLAATYRKQGRWNEAEKLEVQVMNTSKQVLGPEHPDTLTSMANLAATYRKQGRWNEAEKLEVQVMNTSKQVLGPEHPDTLSSMANLALTYWNQGRWNEAEKLNVQVMNTSKQVLGPEHPDTLSSMANLALTYWNQGRWNEAEKLNVQVMNTRKQVLGPEHPDTLTSMNNHAYTLESLEEHNAASQLMTECVRLRSQVLGPDHPDTLSSISILNSWRRNSYSSSAQPIQATHDNAEGPMQENTLATSDPGSQAVRHRRRAIFSRLFRKK